MSDNEHKIPDLTPEQLELLRARFALELGVSAEDLPKVAAILAQRSASDNGESVPVVSVESSYPVADYSKAAVFTNATMGILVIDDLGIKSPSGRFTPETFNPYETKDLRKLYTPRELRSSKYLVLAQEPSPNNNNQPLLLPGRVSKEDILARVGSDSLASLAIQNPEGSFADPEFGKTDFDKKLVALEKKEHDEDLKTQKGFRPGA